MARSNALRALAGRVDTESLRASFVDDLERPYKDAIEGGRAMGAGVGNAAGTGGESTFSVSRSSDRAFLIFNPLPSSRRDVVEVKLWDTGLAQDHLVVTGAGMEPQMVQVLDKGTYWGHEYMTVVFPVDVPGLGYRAVCVSDRLLELDLPSTTPENPWITTMGAWRKIDPPDDTLENEFLKVRLNPASGGVVSLVDKRSGREWIPKGEQAGVFQYSVEANVGMSAWVIGQFMTQEDLLDGGVLKRIHSGPHVQVLRWNRRFGASTLELDVRLRRGVPRLEFCLRVDWREMGSRDGVPNLRVRFPLDVHEPAPRYEIPFGSIQRDLSAGEEVPALRWADLSESDGQGVTLANSSKYGFSLDGHSLSMTLLRASTEPDPLPDMGEHIVEYALAPHGAGWAVSDSVAEGEWANVPLVPLSCGFHSGELPAALTAVSIDQSNVRLAALKMAQDGQALILRLYEVEGQTGVARITLASELIPDGASASEVDMMERPIRGGSAGLAGNVVSVNVPAHGVSIVRVG